MERRKKAAEETKANRSRAALESEQGTGDTSVLDNLLEKLRSGDTVGRKSRRNRQKHAQHASLQISTGENVTEGPFDPSVTTGDDPGNVARDMLARLKSDGFEAFTPTRPERMSRHQRRRSRHRPTLEDDIADLDEAAASAFVPESDSQTSEFTTAPDSPTEEEADAVMSGSEAGDDTFTNEHGVLT